MSFILVTNDDGIESPALVPLVRALEAVAPVRALVPDRERSWISKAITRHEPITVVPVDRDGVRIHAASGYPADCTQIGVHSLFPERPLMVVSGVNVGYNHGLAFLLGSGTVGAAVEGWIAGLPALAFSVGVVEGWPEFRDHAWSAESVPMWERAAAVAAEVVAVVAAGGMPAGVDLLTVNMPRDVTPDMERRVTGLARVGYDRLFSRADATTFVHDFGGGFRHLAGLEGTDLEAARDGVVSITPVRLSRGVALEEGFAARLARRP